MSLPRFNVLVLSVSVAIAVGVAGCSTNPKKSNVNDTGPQRSEQAYYEAAQKSLKRGQWTDANKSLEALDVYYPTSIYNEQAQLDLMYSRFKQADYPGVITAAERFMRIYPSSNQLDYAYYIRGVANMEQNYDGLLRYTELNQAHRDLGYLRIAYNNFREFIQRYPSSKYSVDAAQRMQYINQELAESEINVARFNLKRKAWLAAIQRARWVLEYYPQTPQIPEALATIAYGYQKLGDGETAKQYSDIIRLNYPQLLKSNGDIDLEAARGKASLINRATLGIFGRDANAFIPHSASGSDGQPVTTTEQPEATPSTTEAQDESKSTSKIGSFLRKYKLPSFGLGLPEESAP